MREVGFLVVSVHRGRSYRWYMGLHNGARVGVDRGPRGMVLELVDNRRQ
jgi:hypothetical protein